jgi:hypothetical protein
MIEVGWFDRIAPDSEYEAELAQGDHGQGCSDDPSDFVHRKSIKLPSAHDAAIDDDHRRRCRLAQQNKDRLVVEAPEAVGTLGAMRLGND